MAFWNLGSRSNYGHLPQLLMNTPFLSPDLAALESANSRQGSLDQDPEMVQKLLTAAPPWTKDGHGISGKQPPRDTQYPADVGASVSKPLSISVQSEVKSTPFMTSSGGGVGGSSSSPTTPVAFQILTQPVYDASRHLVATQVGVYYNSNLFSNLAPNSGVSITGLLSSFPADSKDSGWFTPQSTDKIWLEINFYGYGNFKDAKIMSTSTGTFDTDAQAWADNSYLLKTNPPGDSQVQAKLLLATTVTNADNTVTIDQITLGDQVLVDFCIDGYPCRYPLGK